MNTDLQAAENRTDDATLTLLIFRLGGRAYALCIDVVTQIIPMLTLAPLPQSDPSMEGVANIRGRVTPVMNARRRLGLSPVPPGLHTPIILMQVGARPLGLLVDEVIEILSLPAGQITRPAEMLPEGVAVSEVIEGVVFIDHHTIVLLNPVALLAQTGGLEESLALLAEAAAVGADDALPGFDPLPAGEPA